MSTTAVVGASGRTGRAVTARLTADGHRVLAVSRTIVTGPGVELRQADARSEADLHRALEGADAVVVTLGIPEHPALVRVRGARGTGSTIRSEGTMAVIAAMRELRIDRLVVLSSFGVGDSARLLTPTMKMVFTVLLAPQIRDHAVQEAAVRASGLAWTIARPVNLVDDQRGAVLADSQMRTASMSIGRDQVAEQLARWATSGEDTHRIVALSSR